MSLHEVVRSLTGRRSGEHICWAYDDAERLAADLAGYFSDGVASGEQLAFFGPDDSAQMLLTDLDASGQDSSAMVRSGRFVVGSLEDAFLPDGTFGDGAGLDRFRSMALSAQEQGYTGLRVCGEATGLLQLPQVRDVWPAYELRADLLCASTALTALCAYDVRECDEEMISTLRSVHALSGGICGEIGPPFRLHAAVGGGIALSGEVDLDSADDVIALITPCLDDVVEPRLDVSGLTFADVDGVRAIAAIARRLSERFGRVEVRGASATLSKVWQILAPDVEGVTFR